MSSGPLPDRVDATRLFARSGRIEADLPLTRLTRLIPYLAGNVGQAKVVLQFGLDPEGRKQLTGMIEASLSLTCQRCLQPLVQTLSSEIDLLVFNDRTELEKQLGQQGWDAMDRDVLVLDEMSGAEADTSDEMDLLALIEDELIMCLPLAPAHADEACSEALNRVRQDQERLEQDNASNKVSPFAVLAKLKKPGKEVDQNK